MELKKIDSKKKSLGKLTDEAFWKPTDNGDPAKAKDIYGYPSWDTEKEMGKQAFWFSNFPKRKSDQELSEERECE